MRNRWTVLVEALIALLFFASAVISFGEGARLVPALLLLTGAGWILIAVIHRRSFTPQ